MFEQFGGERGVQRFVDELARRLAADPELGPLFAGVDADGLARHREHYFSAVLGGPENYAGRGLRDAHRPLDLHHPQFDRFLSVVDDTLVAVAATPQVADELRALLERLRPVIVTPGSLA